MKEADISKWAKRHNLDRFPSELRSMISDALDLFGDSEQETVQEPVAMPENWFAGMPEEYRKEAWRVATPPAAPASWMEMVTANLVREGVNKHKARELAGHFYGLAAPIPDAITDNSESVEYMAGWNECRDLTIQMRSAK